MPRRVRSRVPLLLGISGTAAISLVLLLGHVFVEIWRVIEFQRLAEKERWPAAARLESGTALARRAAERWYLEIFEETGRKAEAPLRALARMRSREAAPILVELLREWLRPGRNGPFTPRFIADRLRELGTTARYAKPELVELIVLSRRGIRTIAEREPWQDIHQGALAALESVLGEPGTAAGILRNEIEDPSWILRLNAVRELEELGPCAALAIESLVTRLEDPQRSVCVGAAMALGALGPAGKPALPALERARHSGDPDLETAANGAVLRIAHPKRESGVEDEDE